MTDKTTSLRNRLRAVRRRLVWIGSTAGVFWALAGMLVLLTIAAWLDLLWELSPRARVATLAAAGAAAAGLIAVFLGRTLRSGSDRAIARRLDRVTASGGRVLTGVELDRPLDAVYCMHLPEVTSALAEFSGTRGHAKAKEAAEILAKFIRICEPGNAEGIPGLGKLCLVFQPTLLRGLGQTVEQLLGEMGLASVGRYFERIAEESGKK